MELTGGQQFNPELAVIGRSNLVQRVKVDLVIAQVEIARCPVLRLKFEGAVEDGGPFDLVLFGNVLNELDDPAAVLDRYLDGTDTDDEPVTISVTEEGGDDATEP